MKTTQLTPQEMAKCENSFERFMLANIGILQGISPLNDQERAKLQEDQKNSLNMRKVTQLGPVNFYSEHYAAYWAKKQGQDVDEAIKRMHECKEKAINYSKLVYGDRRPFKKKSINTQLMDYDKAKSIFWHRYLSKSFQYKQKAYIVDEDNAEAIDELLKYFIRDKNCQLDINKGVCIIGGVGTGKSNIMKQFSKFCADMDLETAFNFVDMADVIAEVDEYGLRACKKYMAHDVCFDEIALRQTVVNSHGTKIMPADEVIQGRYKRFTKTVSRPTHFTANIDLNPYNEAQRKKLESIYDRRSIDRLREMCNFVYLGGESRR